MVGETDSSLIFKCPQKKEKYEIRTAADKYRELKFVRIHSIVVIISSV